MKAEQIIRATMKKLAFYPDGEINACQIYKDWEGWKIQKFGEPSWSPGRTLPEVLERLKEIVDMDKD